jgi:hypothetical protein
MKTIPKWKKKHRYIYSIHMINICICCISKYIILVNFNINQYLMP